MRKILCAALSAALPLFGMELEESGGTAERAARTSCATEARAAGRPSEGSSDILAPQNIDVRCCLESGGRLCYAMQAVCKVGVGVCEVASLIFGGICVTETKKNPDLAWATALGGVISNALGLGLTYALFKAGEKVRKFDRAIGRARSQREGAAEA